MKTLALFTSSLVLACFGFAHSARAATTVITSGTDAELRAAVANCGTVTFNFDGVITLTNEIVVTCAVTIDATGRSVVLSGGNSNRLFNVQSNTSLTLVHLTLANGLKRGSNGLTSQSPLAFNGESVFGGGLTVTSASLTAIGCSFVSNSVRGGAGGTSTFPSSSYPQGGAASGGAIYAVSSSVVLSNCNFDNNLGLGGAGGINFGLGPFQIGTSGNAFGAAVFATGGDLSVTACSFSNNLSAGRGAGGGLWCQASNLHIANSRFVSNMAQSGGAISDQSARSSLFNVAFISNTATGATYERYGAGLSHAFGGAYEHLAGIADVIDCSFTLNRALGAVAGQGAVNTYHASTGYGGAVAHRAGNLALTRSLLASNLAQAGASIGGNPPVTKGHGMGGAVFVTGQAGITNCTLAHNQVEGPAFYGGSGLGGGLCLDGGGTALLNACTVSGNSASSYNNVVAKGGGLHQITGSLSVLNSILAYNQTNVSWENANGAITDLGHNLSSDATPVWTSGTSLNNTDPLLLPLDNYGGPTLTMALHAGSPALNTGDCALAPLTDQRGFPRPDGPGCDIGAYEGASAPALQIFRVNSTTNLLRWIGLAGRTYRVDVATSLNGWSPYATNVAATNGLIDLPVPVSAPARFFQLQAE